MADFSVAKDSNAVIEQRLSTAELLFRCAAEMGLEPSWVTPNGLFAVFMDGHEQYVNIAHSPLNSHASASLAKDKYLTRLILERHNMQNIPFARPRTLADAEAFLDKYKKIIAKPVSGSGSRNVHIVTEAAQLQELSIKAYILEKYIAGQELRYLVLNETVIGVYRSDYGTSVEATRSLQCTTYPQPSWDLGLISSSVKIARLLGLRFAAVDYLIDASGQAHILEVNTSPDFKWFHAPTSGPVIDVARKFLETVFENQEKSTSLGEIPLGARPSLAYS